jgi:hypothetical protein
MDKIGRTLEAIVAVVITYLSVDIHACSPVLVGGWR